MFLFFYFLHIGPLNEDMASLPQMGEDSKYSGKPKVDPEGIPYNSSLYGSYSCVSLYVLTAWPQRAAEFQLHMLS